MKYLIIFFLLLSSCTDKENTNQESSTQESAPQEKLSPELIKLEESEEVQSDTDPLVVSYDIEPKLLRFPYDLSESIYWDSNSNIYYGSTSVVRTNNIIYQFDSLKATNHIYYTDKYEGTDKYIYIDSTIYKYVGSLSLLERVYIDTNNPPQQYINTLKAIDDSIIICYDKKKFLNELPVYPSTVTLYTNKIGEEFYRTPDYILRPVESNEFRYKDDLIEI